MIVYKTHLTKYKPLLTSKGELVFKNYSKLKNYLRQNLGEEIAAVFAEPHITDSDLKNRGSASWRSEAIGSEAVPINHLPEERKEKAKKLLQSKLATLYEHAQKMLDSNNQEDNRWGELITKALEIPDEAQVMVEGENIVLTLWGFHYADSDRKNEGFKKGVLAKAYKEREMQETVPVAQNMETGNNEPQVQNTEEHKPDIVHEEKQTVTGSETTPAKQQPVTNPDNIVPPPTSGLQKQNWWRRNRWWLVLLFLLLLFLWLKGCNQDTNILPKEPGRLIPIDTTKIITDPDTVKSIVGNLLNVALVGNKHDINEFAEQFKKLFPGEEYQVIYYDTTTFRLQLKIPSEEREKVKTSLTENIKGFELLIWYEGIFQKNNRPTDPGFADPERSWYHKEIEAYEAWDVTRGDSDLVIAVLDDGFDLSHPEFRGKIYRPWNVPDYSSRVSTYGKFYHGTHVAGTALGLVDNGKGVAGIAPHCKFMPVQVSDRNGIMSSTAIIDGVLYAINHGANVINMSLGMQIAPNVTQLPTAMQENLINRLYKDEEKFWEQLFKIAYKKNIVVVLAAGNQNVLVGIDAMQRSKYAIKVSAVDPNEEKAEFSNYGKYSTISAPGVHIFSSVPNSGFAYLDGTSMASPVVAGGVALLKSANPVLTYDDIVSLLQSTGKPVNASAEYIGNIIQLGKAMEYANRSRKQMPTVECPDIQGKIDSLLQQIEQLKQKCENGGADDTLHIPRGKGDLSFVGKWKSTSYIYSSSSGKKVTVYFDFYNNSTGLITLVESDNTTCTAPLTLTIKPDEFNIMQREAALCLPPPKKYFPYYFKCTPDKTGCAECVAQNKQQSSNNFSFKLIKIK